MSYEYEVKSSPNYSSRAGYGYGSKVRGITIHHWGSTGQTHDGVVRYLTRPRGNTSAHYVVSAGRVTQLIDDSLAAWHSGNNRGNGTTIGIECRPEMSDGDFDTLVELCADIEERHGSLKYYRHKDWKNTACPGRYSGRIGELVESVNALHRNRKNGTADKPKRETFPLEYGHFYYTEDRRKRVHSGYWPEDRAAIRKIQRKVGVTVDGRYGTKRRSETKAGVKRWQRKHGITADGAVGSETWAEMFG